MKPYLKSLLLAHLLAALPASATPILVDEWLGGSGDSDEKIAIRSAINDYNTANNPDLPQLFDNTNPPPGSRPNLLAGWVQFLPKTNVANGPHLFEWTAPGTYSSYYVMSKFGQGQGTFDHALHYLSAGDMLSYNPGGASAPNGLSHYWIWATGPGQGVTVPDSGATGLLGAIAILVFLTCRPRRHS